MNEDQLLMLICKSIVDLYFFTTFATQVFLLFLTIKMKRECRVIRQQYPLL